MLCIELKKFNVHSSDGATALILFSRWSSLMLCTELKKFNVHSSDGKTALTPVLQVELLDAVHRVQRPFFGRSNSSRSCSPGGAS